MTAAAAHWIGAPMHALSRRADLRRRGRLFDPADATLTAHLPAVCDMNRVLRPGGILKIDVPNVASLRNRNRMLRRHRLRSRRTLTYTLLRSLQRAFFFPLRHNREFTREALHLLLRKAAFKDIEVRYLKSRRHCEGIERLLKPGTMLRDAFPFASKISDHVRAQMACPP